MMKPTNLAKMIEATQLVEERNKVLSLGLAGVGGVRVKNSKPTPSQPSPWSFTPLPQTTPSRDFSLKLANPFAGLRGGSLLSTMV